MYRLLQQGDAAMLQAHRRERDQGRHSIHWKMEHVGDRLSVLLNPGDDEPALELCPQLEGRRAYPAAPVLATELDLATLGITGELGCGYVVGVSNATDPPMHATGKGVWGWTDDQGCVEDGVVDANFTTERPYHCYGANDRVGVLADMETKRLQFYKNGQKMEGVVVKGFPADVRIVTTPYNRGVKATLSFPLDIA